jgi:monoterpene epsilon-lactone hydrolase
MTGRERFLSPLARGLTGMTIPTQDPNRALWSARARGELSPSWESLTSDPGGVEFEQVQAPPGLWLRPPAATAGPAILAIHGGGFVSGSVWTHWRMFGHLARAAATTTFVAEYGLLPDHVFPSQLDSIAAAYRWLLDQDVTAVAVVGDSCGATLAVGLAMRARDEGLPRPAGLLLISASADLEATGGSYETGSDPFFTREMVRGLAAGYLAGADPRDPLAAPLHADLAGLPPTYLQVGAEESLLDDSRRLSSRLRTAGVAVRLDEFAGQLHTFQMGARRTPVADDAIGRAGSWLRSVLRR